MKLDESDWRYNPERLKLRRQALSILLEKFGSELENGEPKYTNESMYNCSHDWVSGGHFNCNGIVKYYETYYGPIFNNMKF